MKKIALAYLIGTTSLPAGTLVFSDSFNAPDSTNFDTSTQTGRRNGLLGETVQMRSSRIQHRITGSQLDFQIVPTPPGGSGRIRFQQIASLPTNVWTNFAASPAAATILAEGGLRIAFDWTSTDIISANWISFNVGINPIASGEPAVRVNDAGTDFGILFRNNGGTQFFKNAVATNGSNYPASLGPKRVVIDLAFTSFADGSTVNVKASVNGTIVANGQSFTWNNNSGAIFMELGNLATGTKFDNFSITGLTGFSQSLAAPPFYSSLPAGTSIGTFSGFGDDIPEPSTFTLVAGGGDTDNSKFRITGDRLELGNFDFQSVPDRQAFSIRVRGTGDNSGSTNETVYSVSLIADNDSDDLPDAWELSKTTSLTALNGRASGPGPGPGTGDFDGDGLTDMEEFQLSTTYATINPTLIDSDGDGLSDRLELFPDPLTSRPITNPVLFDSDSDGLSDSVETNTGTFLSASDTGTDPLDYDFDNDLWPDGYELSRGSLLLDASSTPTLPPSFTYGILTTDESSGISADKTYTHAFSGGFPATINGLLLPALTTATPVPIPNFTWISRPASGAGGAFSQIAIPTLQDWIPANGDVTGSGITEMLSGFVFSANADTPRSRQVFTLTNLTPGLSYELRLYNRVWSKTGSGRPVNLTITNGTHVRSAYILQDRPGAVTGTGLNDTAYYLSFPYTAISNQLVIEAATPPTTIPISGSMHLYGLTNQTLTTTPFKITDVVRQASPPSVTLTFNSAPGAFYAVDSSVSMNQSGDPDGWTQLTGDLASAGETTTFTDSTAGANGSRRFYRVRRVEPPAAPAF